MGEVAYIPNNDEETDDEDPLLESDVEKGSLPDMFSMEYIGLYCQYAAIGILSGLQTTCGIFCPYVFHGDPNLCANAKTILSLTWVFKLGTFYRIFTDSKRLFYLFLTSLIF